jgi:predicted DNA-binding protein (MmcQ/YjbR family)
VAHESWNPYFRALWEYCAAKPQAVEDHPWGETVFKIAGKVFAFLGHPDRAGVTVKAAPDELDVLLALPYVRRSAYIGRYGWISVAIDSDDTLEFALRLVDQSYQLVAPKTKRKKAPGKSPPSGPK